MSCFARSGIVTPMGQPLITIADEPGASPVNEIGVWLGDEASL